MEETVRPNPFRWLLYAFGAGLPARNRTWVLHDVSAPTWFLRHLARTALQIAPFAAVLLWVIPGPFEVRVAAVAMGTLLGLFYGAVFAEPMAEHRAIKAGFREGSAEAMRQARKHPPGGDRTGGDRYPGWSPPGTG